MRDKILLNVTAFLILVVSIWNILVFAINPSWDAVGNLVAGLVLLWLGYEALLIHKEHRRIAGLRKSYERQMDRLLQARPACTRVSLT